MSGRQGVKELLDGFESRKVVSREGREWLTAAIDPFHDVNFRLDGYPDIDSSATVVQVVNQTASITIPSGVTTCHIYFNPDLVTQNYKFHTGTNRIDCTTGTNPMNIYPVGWQMTNGANTFADQAVQTNGFDFSSYTHEGVRLIAGGFEVTNTTSENNVSGSVIVYQQPCKKALTNSNFVDGVSAGCWPVMWCDAPPLSPMEAMALPGSRQWDAQQGAYVVFKQQEAANPFRQSSSDCYVYSRGSSKSVGTALYQHPPNTVTMGAIIPIRSDAFHLPVPFMQSGAYFTGLSSATTLQVTVKLFLERAPNADNSDLVTLSSRSPSYDPIALEMFAFVMHALPPGVPVGFNALGDWWRLALRAARDHAPAVGRAVSYAWAPAEKWGKLVGDAAQLALPKETQRAREQLAQVARAQVVGTNDQRAPKTRTRRSKQNK